MVFFNTDKLKQTSVVKDLSNQPTILVVDDEENNLVNLKGALEEDYCIITAANGKEALTIVQSEDNPEKIRVIISDQRMPELTGVEFLEKTIPIIPKTIRIILSGFSDIDAIIDAINKGQVYKFIRKPFDREELRVTVKRALELFELEDQNVLLTASNRKLAELNQNKEKLLRHLNDIYEKDLKSVTTLLDQGIQGATEQDQEALREIYRKAHQIEEALRPVTSLYVSEQVIKNKRILLAENDKKQQILAKLALGGTGVAIDIASNLEEGERLINKQKYDIICANADLIALVDQGRAQYPDSHFVFITSEDAPAYLSTLRKYPFLSNIVSRNDEDRTFTLKNMLTTVSKLLNKDLFGLEKYLNWGVEVYQFPIVNSTIRAGLIERMEVDLSRLGVRKKLLDQCSAVAEELLLNAIYDAPTNTEGKSIYNHLSRSDMVELKPEEQGIFRYACDGLLVGISVEDPFGAFSRDVILDYLESCYEGRWGALQQDKGGAGLGLFQSLEMADLIVWNVKPKIRTEVIALFNIAPQVTKSRKTTSFHYFSG
ncbi:MAG: response regulator [SAR324 cluster bacterium]|nr:response regulator [SAR324 cluster bacterium]